MKLGSLFDGSGTFPFAAELDGIEPVWASEIEPFPVLVTHTRFPSMKHLGDVTKINGAEIEPVDILTFGSPCQDLSVAGAQKGLQDGERSSLFFEAIRIIKEMRQATDGKYPRIIVFENVPGIFSSQKGRDFHEVLKQFVFILDGADVPRPAEKNGKFVWRRNGCILGDGYSFAWRQLDAQFFGVPQRRKRVFVVGCLDSERAADLLFNTNGLPRDFAQSERARQRASADTGRGVDGTDRVVSDCDSVAEGNVSDKRGFPQSDGKYLPFVCYDARGNGDGSTVCTITGDHNDRVTDYTPLIVSIEGNGSRPSHQGDGYSTDGVMYTLNSVEQHKVCYAIGIDRAAFNQGKNAQYKPQFNDNLQPSLTAKGPGAVLYAVDVRNSVIDSNTTQTIQAKPGGGYSLHTTPCICYAIGNGQADQTDLHDVAGALNCMHDQQAVVYGVPLGFRPENTKAFEEKSTTICNGTNPGHHQGVLVCYTNSNIHYIVRRLMPEECARLMGFPDWYCDRLSVENPTEKDMAFWRKVFETYANATGGKPKTDRQIRKWLADPMSDSAQYKMWGNGIVLPVARYIIRACKEVLNEQG